jgi:hypothetical protein
MHVVIRIYRGKGTKKLFDAAEAHEAELQSLMRAIDGLVNYTLARNADGGFSVTVCRDKRGINRSLKTARAFLARHVPETSHAAMHISEGTVITHVQ